MNERYQDGDIVSAELDYDTILPTITFFVNDTQQILFLDALPPGVQFAVCLLPVLPITIFSFFFSYTFFPYIIKVYLHSLGAQVEIISVEQLVKPTIIQPPVRKHISWLL